MRVGLEWAWSLVGEGCLVGYRVESGAGMELVGLWGSVRRQLSFALSLFRFMDVTMFVCFFSS